MKRFLLTVIMLLAAFSISEGQYLSASRPDPEIAFLKSLALPGWGHYYVDSSDWLRGKYHLAADAVLILSYLGFSIHSDNLRHNWYSYGALMAGVNIEGRNRRFQLAVGDFDNLSAYNDYQSRTRNWDRLITDSPENRWNWPDDQSRHKYNRLRNRFERIDQQLPALLGLMALNRIISGISAYNRARKLEKVQSLQTAVYLSPYRTGRGLMANITVSF